jgi:hypothetical protein
MIALLASTPACAQSAASQALGDSAKAVGEGVEVGVKTAVGVVAAPVTIVGAASTAAGAVAEGAGKLAGKVGGQTLDAGSAAAQFAAEPLRVDDDVIVAPMPKPQVPYDAQGDGEGDAKGGKH